MAQYFSRYQRITQNTRLIYISQEGLDVFRTLKLLGLKVIEVKAHPTNEVDQILDMKEHGVDVVEMHENRNGSRTLRLKLK